MARPKSQRRQANSEQLVDKPQSRPFPFGHAVSMEEVNRMIENPDSIKTKDIDQMIAKLRQIHDEIDKKLDAIYQKTGLTPSYIRNYLSNPNNFSPIEWTIIQKDRQTRLSALMGATKVEEMMNKPRLSEQEIEKKARDRRGKMVGGRKNWIPMK